MRPGLAIHPLLVLLCTLPLAAETVVDPARFSIQGSFDVLAEPAAGEIQQEPSRFHDPRIAYEQIRLLAQEIAIRMRGLPDGSGSVLHHARLLGSDEELVAFDTRATRLARIPARVLIQAPTVDITEVPPDGDRAMAYRVALEGVRPVEGTVLLDGGWHPIRIAAGSWMARLQADLLGSRLADPSLDRVILRGDPASVDLDMQAGSAGSRSRLLELRLDPVHGLDRVLLEGAVHLERLLPAADDRRDRFTLQADRVDLPILHAQRSSGTGRASGAVSWSGPGLLGIGSDLHCRMQQGQTGTEVEIVGVGLAGTGDQPASLSVAAGRWPLRGRLQARDIAVERLSATTQERRYHLAIRDVSELAGALRRERSGRIEWLPFSGRAALIEAEIVHHIATGLIRPVHIRFEAGPEDPVDLTIDGGSWPGRMIGDWISIDCDADGRPERVRVSPDMRFQGLPAH
ncbi:MAG: hypothetical protein ACOCXJ_08210 [Planctomycetota bacterium]